MLQHARDTIPKGQHLVSGGAAWADHLAVILFLEGHAKELTLHLPAPFEKGMFIGPERSSASTANYYHAKFSDIRGQDSLEQIEEAIQRGAKFTQEPPTKGYSGMFARNRKVAQVDGLIAYTFGEGDVPANGGTKDTWDISPAEEKLHVPLPFLY